MKVPYKYKAWLTPWGVEAYLRGESVTDFSLTICSASTDMTKHGYQEVSEGTVYVDLHLNKGAVAAAAVQAIRHEIGEEQKKFDNRVSELLDQIRRFEALTFNPTTGNAE